MQKITKIIIMCNTNAFEVQVDIILKNIYRKRKSFTRVSLEEEENKKQK